MRHYSVIGGNSRKPLIGTYSGYVVAENERTEAETQREVVKKLLAKLQESERTVVTLHYFGEMSSSEIGAFLGVSANTVRSRLRRAQQRLKRGTDDKRSFRKFPNHTKPYREHYARDFVPENYCTFK